VCPMNRNTAGLDSIYEASIKNIKNK